MPFSFLKAFAGRFKQKKPAATEYAIEIAPGTTVLLESDKLKLRRSTGDEQDMLGPSGLAVEIGEETRALIARKICRLLPELVTAKKLALLEYTLRVLKTLSTDQVSHVRRIMAEELAARSETPHELALMLAWDLAPEVHVPVLECSPVLTDDDLIEIVRASGIPGVAESIARRPSLSATVSDAVARSGSKPAVTELLNNKGAAIGEPSLTYIAERTDQCEVWVEPLVRRPELSIRIIRRITGSVSQALIQSLVEAGHINSQLAEALYDIAREHSNAPVLSPSAERNVEALAGYDLLDPERLQQAIDRGEREFITHTLSLKSGFDKDTVERMLRTQNPKLITALTWKAGLSMRIATQLQLMAGIHHREALLAKGGTEYPLKPSDMKRLLELFEH